MNIPVQCGQQVLSISNRDGVIVQEIDQGAEGRMAGDFRSKALGREPGGGEEPIGLGGAERQGAREREYLIAPGGEPLIPLKPIDRAHVHAARPGQSILGQAGAFAVAPQ